MDLLITYLADRDTPCPGCGYNLRGLTGERCPECFQELQLRVGLVEPRMRLYLTALIGAAAGMGLNGLLVIYLLIAVMRMGGPALWGYFAAHNLIGLAVHGSLVWGLMRWGAWVRRMWTGLRIALAAAMWLLSLVNIMLFSMFVK